MECRKHRGWGEYQIGRYLQEQKRNEIFENVLKRNACCKKKSEG